MDLISFDVCVFAPLSSYLICWVMDDSREVSPPSPHPPSSVCACCETAGGSNDDKVTNLRWRRSSS